MMVTKRKRKQPDDVYKIYSAVKRSFSKSKTYKLAMARAKSDKKGPRGGARYDCAACCEDFGVKQVQVDHINPVVPIGVMMRDMTWCNIINRTYFCGLDNLQVLCADCHGIKSKTENAERKVIKDAVKTENGRPRLKDSILPCGCVLDEDS